MKTNKYFTAFFAGLILIFSGCNIGLGEEVDLTGPELVLLSPSIPRQCVKEAFDIKGTVTDNFGVKRVTVTIGEYQWYHEDDNWMYKSKNSDSYVPYTDSLWEVNDKIISWEIRHVDIESTGLVELKVSSIDTSGNTSASSEKMILINIDKTPPVVGITSPNIYYETWDELNTAFGSYGKTSEDYQQLYIVNNLETKEFKLSGTASDDNKVKSVTVHLKKVNIETSEVEQNDLITKKIVLVNETTDSDAVILDSLRTWSVDVTAEELATLGNGKSYLQISSECSDTADNASDGLVIHGYIVYWPNASKPWINLSISTEDTDADRTKIYAGNTISGNSFDNTQITSIVQNISYRKDSTSNYAVLEDYSNIQLYSYNASDKEAEIFQTKDFSIILPGDVGQYEIKITTVDDCGNASKTFTGYAYIADSSYPSLNFTEVTNPFGDSNGNISIKIEASDDISVKSIKYKYAITADDKKNYADKLSTYWDSVPVLFNLENQSPSSSHADETGLVKKFWKFEHIINLFSEGLIGMNGNKLTEQTFIFLVEDNAGNKSISKFVTPADVNAPVLTFDSINGALIDNDVEHNVFTTDGALKVFTDDFTLGGSWSDDSYNIWNENGKDGKPVLSVSVRGQELPANKVVLNTNGTWIAYVDLDLVKDSGNVVSAMDVSLSIKDIGGTETSIQKGFEIDTTLLALDYVSADVPSGTYPAGKEIKVSLNFNKSTEFEGSGNPYITFNNGKKAYIVSKASSKKLEFLYTVQSGDDVKKLLVSDISYDNCNLKDSSNGNTYSVSELKNALNISANVINKDISLLTTIPTYKSHLYDEANNQLQIVFNGLVTPNAGTIVITQNEDTLLVPAVLTKDEYNNTSSAVQAFYEESTNGASSTFVPDLTTKYVLKYDKNTNDSELLTAYKATGAHKLSFNILGESVSYTQHDDTDDSNDTTTFTINIGNLPVKGTSYSFDIASGLVINEAKVSNTADSGKEITSTGTETPVIRIYKPTQTITGCSNNSYGTVTHDLSTTFKIDCETPGSTLTYSYDCYVPPVCEVSSDTSGWYGTANDVDSRQEEIHVKFVYNGTTYSTNRTAAYSGGKPTIVPVINNDYSKTTTAYSSNTEIPLGKNNSSDIDYKNGLTYKITATANNTETAYDVAYRTTLVLKDYSGYANSGRTTSYSYWPYSSNNCTIFLRGGENKEGANATAGLPASWNINEKDKVVMMKADGNDYYFTSWNITVDKFYFQPLLGLCDSSTNTANNQGPAYSSYQQDGIIFRIPEYPIGKGEYMTVTMNGRYDIGIPGKVMKHR